MCYVRLTYPVVSLSLKFHLRNYNTLWMLSVAFQWPPFSLSPLKVFGEICVAFVLNWTSERKCLSESKWNQVFILGGNMGRDKQPKRKPSPQEQAAFAFCQLARVWEPVKSPSRSYFNPDTAGAEAAGGAAQGSREKCGEAENVPADWHHPCFTPSDLWHF